MTDDPSTSDFSDLLGLAGEFADRVLRPAADQYESEGSFPRETFRELGRAGLLGLPFPAAFGGADVPYAGYVAALDVLGAAWATVGVGVSVHVLSCLPVLTHGTQEQKDRLLPEMIGGELLGAFCLSEEHAGSDPAAMRTSARRVGDDYVLNGAKAWTTHGGEADYYTVFARTDDGPGGISCFHVPGDARGLSAGPPERKMGLTGSRTSTMSFDGVRIPATDRIGEEGQGLQIALAALDCGRLGIAAVATGLAQAAMNVSVRYAAEREAFGKPIARHEGIGFLLADMAAGVLSSRATYLSGARRKDANLPFTMEAAVAKLVATDNAMKTTIDAVQILGGAGYVRDFPVERFMREAKVMQIFEGTNQIQRVVISRSLTPSGRS